MYSHGLMNFDSKEDLCMFLVMSRVCAAEDIDAYLEYPDTDIVNDIIRDDISIFQRFDSADNMFCHLMDALEDFRGRIVG